MSEPASDPPVPPPNQPAREDKPAENASADAETAAATGEDVKMDEAPRTPKPVEETWDDIPEHVVKVSAREHNFSASAVQSGNTGTERH